MKALPIATIAFLVFLSGCGPSDYTLTHGEAAARLREHGFVISSTSNCYDKDKPGCVSLDGLKSDTLKALIALKASCVECRTLVISGGTEVGHETGAYHSHRNGYKVDLLKSNSDAGTLIAGLRKQRSFGSDWEPQVYLFVSNGYLYSVRDEGGHWDIEIAKMK